MFGYGYLYGLSLLLVGIAVLTYYQFQLHSFKIILLYKLI